MISITQKSDTEISIIFKKEPQTMKVQVINAIVNSFPENQNYLFVISGVDIDRFMEDMNSRKYLLKIDEKHKFIKNLPVLFLFSNCVEDSKVFGQYTGSFNEGYMYLYILKNEVELCDEQYVLDFIQENKVLMLEVASDGDVLNLSCDDIEKTQLYNLLEAYGFIFPCI